MIIKSKFKFQNPLVGLVGALCILSHVSCKKGGGGQSSAITTVIDTSRKEAVIVSRLLVNGRTVASVVADGNQLIGWESTSANSNIVTYFINNSPHVIDLRNENLILIRNNGAAINAYKTKDDFDANFDLERKAWSFKP